MDVFRVMPAFLLMIQREWLHLVCILLEAVKPRTPVSRAFPQQIVLLLYNNMSVNAPLSRLAHWHM